ncbi:alpha/beta hydrolase [Dactylosporangium sp. NPDC005555]|uniref:alpha/beta hydrolase n=1 Tax=Dactylosporangium sp. NPDC005555 TaxID=3154889 RepID=UPI00339E3FE6
MATAALCRRTRFPYAVPRRHTRASTLGNARLLTYRADGHVSATSFNPCILTAILTYLDTVTLTAEGASCTQNAPAALAAEAPRRVMPATR